jgi:hypothetical protein
MDELKPLSCNYVQFIEYLSAAGRGRSNQPNTTFVPSSFGRCYSRLRTLGGRA